MAGRKSHHRSHSQYPPSSTAASHNPRHGGHVTIDDNHRYPPNADLIIEERILTQQREIQALLLDNQRIAASHVSLKQELTAAQKDLHIFSTVSSEVKRERDTQVRDLYDRSLRMEADLRLLNAQKGELSDVGGQIQKLRSVNQELSEKLVAIHGELARTRALSDFNERVALSEEIEAVRREIRQGRLAIEQEKKNRAINLKQSNRMEKHMFSVAREIEELRSKLANAEKRAKAAAVAAPDPGYGASHGSRDQARHQFQNPNESNP